MPGIVSLLDETHSTLVKEIWQELKTDCGLTGVLATPRPHFSWQVADGYQRNVLENIIQNISATAKPLVVHTTGLGFFTAESPVAYIPVVRSKQLSEFHEIIWDHLIPISENPSPYYAPSNWIPHITLATSDLLDSKLGCLLDKLVVRSLNWEIEIDNLTFIDETEEKSSQIKYHYWLIEKD